MRKFIGYTILFIAVLLFSLAVNFPAESALRYALYKAGRKSGLDFNYESGKFSFNKAEMENLDIYKGSSPLMRFQEATIKIGLGGAVLNAEKDGGSLNLTLSPSRAKFSCKDFLAVTEGTKFFKKIILSGELPYDIKKQTGKGTFKIALRESLNPSLVNTDIMAVSSVRISPKSITLDLVDIHGIKLRGSGNVEITVDGRDFENSPIKGDLSIKTAVGTTTVKISGTVGNIQAVPQFGGNKTREVGIFCRN